MFAVELIQGTRRGGTPAAAESIASAVQSAKRKGLLVGASVRIGRVHGRIIGYNVAVEGLYPGCFFPLLVYTELGVTKCALAEVQLV